MRGVRLNVLYKYVVIIPICQRITILAVVLISIRLRRTLNLQYHVQTELCGGCLLLS